MHKLCALTADQVGILLRTGVINEPVAFTKRSKLTGEPTDCVAEVIVSGDKPLQSLHIEDCVAIAAPLSKNMYGAVYMEERAILLEERFTI